MLSSRANVLLKPVLTPLVVSRDGRKQAMEQSFGSREAGHSLVCHCQQDWYHPVTEIKDLLAFSESCVL